ncbi:MULTISPECIES: DUF6531 domain-containing protein [Amycolatopsis]|uniref:AHH domain-containing protein n=1 Tax=Amycolatopsis dendrobii TaxID=2760662 RepID=A0A7W3ZDN7_9PSEU|nr:MULTISPECIES: DUF6531 domain-containing protein [Amycolatopsis]MBB1157079.1 AHH domain-containing protein [Amycolatopsis dendrobii]UKD59525.1 DUF6531 domain-containing protein [Amycolatopsis sp. FU40]
MSNPLVAQRQDSTTWHSGINVLDDAAGVYDGVQSGSWIEGGIAALGTGLDMLTIAMNPVGTLISYGLNWLIEHVKPLQDALNQLAGDGDQISAYSQTWKNVGQATQQAAKDLAATVQKDTANWKGAAADAYRANIGKKIDHINAAATCANTISTVVEVVGVITAAVRCLVRDMITQAVGDFIQDALEEVCSLGLGTPVVVAQVVEQVSAWLEKIGALIKKLINSVEKLRPLMSKLEEIFASIKKVLAELHGGRGEAGDATHVSSAEDPHTSPHGKEPGADGTQAAHADDPAAAPDGHTSPSEARPGNPDGEGSVHENGEPRKDGRSNDGKCEGGDPIDLATGDMLMVQTDVELPGALPLVVTRAHLSSYRAGRFFGPSWASTLDERLESDGTRIWYAAPDGVLLAYPVPPEDGSPVLPEEGARWPLARTPDGGYAITCPELRRTLSFSPSHQAGAITVLPLASIADRNGDRIDVDRDENGVPTLLRHSGGYRIAVDSGNGLVTGLRLLGPDAGAGIDLVRYRYDDAGRLAEILNSSGLPVRFEYDSHGRVVKWTDRNDRWYAYVFDELGRCVRTDGTGGALACSIGYDSASRTTTYTDSLGQVTTYHFNDAWQLVRAVDPLGHTVVTERDRYDRLLSRTDPLGQTTRFRYDEDGRLIAVTDPDGRTTTAEYDSDGQPVVLTGPDGAVWRNEYDERGNLAAVTDPAGALTRYHLDSRGHPAGLTDALGQTRRVESDAAGQPVAVTDFLGATTRYTRDVFGRISTVTDPLGGITRFSWTVEGKLLSCTQPDGTTEHWRYDGEGNEIAYVDALGQTIRTEYTFFDSPSAKIDVDGSRLEFAYDTELRLRSVTGAGGRVWRYDYDAAGNLVSETDFGGRTSSYAYDPARQLIARTNGAGEVMTFRHDARGNVIEKSVGGRVTTYEFDAADQLIRAAGPDAELVLERDALGRVLRESCNGRAVESVYDLLGRRILRVTPAGVRTGCEYNGNDQPVVVRTDGHTVRLSYDAAGREVRRQLGGGAMVNQSWDANHRLVGQQVTDASARSRQRRAYHYRADSVVTSIQDQLAGTRQYDLDRWGRVTAVRGAGWTERYAYNEFGDVSSAEWPDQDPAPQGGREYAGVVLRRGGAVHYRHDAQGRIVERSSRTLSGQRRVWSYTWDSDDRLTGVTTPDGTRWRYRHDPLGRRIAKERLGPDGVSVAEETVFAWDGVHLVEQSTRAVDRPDVTTTTWDRDGVRPVSQVERRTAADAPQHVVDERFFAIVTDLLGTPTELVDESGAVAWHARRTVWGVTSRAPDSTTDTPLRFPGQYFDPETGWHYNYFRHYDPATAEYTSADPLGLAGGPNQRSYAINPMAWLDYLGLLTCKQNAAILRNNMAAEGRAPAPGEAAAHIVPSGGTKNQWAWGAKSRDLLDAHKVDINDPANGIPLGHPTPHNYTHRGGFHEKVYNRLQGVVAQGQARGLSQTAIGGLLRNELRGIGKSVLGELSSGAPGPGAYWTA